MRKGYRRTIRSDYGCITPQKVNEEWSVDIAGPLNLKTKLGNKYMLMIVDGYTGKIWAKALKETSGKTIIRATKEILTSWGKPERLQIDNGTYFVGDELGNWLTEKHIGLKKAL